jgi:hypothetical protein
MYAMIATRANRGGVLLAQISKSARVKRPGVTQLDRIRKLAQQAMGQFSELVNILEELAE